MTINWIAVAVATLGGMIVGAVWYAGPVFGRAWRAAAHLAPDAPANRPLAYGGAFVSTAITSILVAGLASLVAAGLSLGLLPAALLTSAALWFGVAFARPLINQLFESRSARLFAINTGHDLAVLLLVAVIIGSFGN